MYRLKDAFRTDVPIRMIFESPTVAQLAERLERLITSGDGESGSVAHTTSRLVPLPSSNGNATIFCLHLVGGQIHWYKYLAEHLGGKYSLYGVQSRALADPAKEHQTLPAMADDYAAIIRERLPDGPYRLLGYSSGGIFPMAVGAALERSGCRVEFIGLIDSYLQTDGEITVERQSLHNLILMLRGNLEGQFQGLDEFWDNLLDQSAALHGELLPLSNDRRLERICDRLAALNPTFGHFRELIGQQLDLYNIHHRLTRTYEPSKMGAALYACWAGQTLPGTHAAARVDWGKFTTGKISVDVLEADHFTMMRPPAVETLSERTSSSLGQVEDSRPLPAKVDGLEVATSTAPSPGMDRLA